MESSSVGHLKPSTPDRAMRGGPDDQPCVLVVDDIAANLLAIEGILRSDDLVVVLAYSAREAFEILLERSVALAIVDVQMPEMNGIELVEMMRGVERTRHIPIIFVTASMYDYSRVFQGYEAGAIDYLFKPIDDRVLRSKVDALVALDRQRRQLALALEQAEFARHEAEKARAETAFLFRLSEFTSHCRKPEELYEPALDAVRTLLGAERASIMLLDQEGKMRFTAWRGLSEAYRAALDGYAPRGDLEPHPILIGDVANDESTATYRELLAKEDIGALAVVPLIYQGHALGSFVLYWSRARDFSKHEENLALTIASHIAQALERARILDAERVARDQLAQLQHVTAALNEAVTRDAIGDVCLPTICAAIGAPIGALYAIDDAGTELETVRLIGFSSEQSARIQRIPLATPGAMTHAVRARKPVFVDSREQFEQQFGSDGEHEVEARAVAPLVLGDRVLGALAVAFPGARTISQEERRFFVAIADQCAQAMDRARLLEIEHRSRLAAETAERRRAALQSISDSALAHLDLDALLGEMLARVRRIFGADVASLLLTDADQRHFVRTACSAVDRSSWETPPIPLDQGVDGQIARERRPIVVDDDPALIELAWPVLEERLGSLAGVPLVLGQDLLGVLHVGCIVQRTFSPDDIELLEMVAERVAIAIDRTMTYENLRRTEERLRIALDSGQLGIWEWIPATGRVIWSPKLEEIHGYTPGTFPCTLEAYERCFHADDKEEIRAYIQRCVETGQAPPYEYRIIRSDGQVRWIAAQGKAFADAEGNVVSFTGICLDVTDRVEIERLREKALADLKRDLQLNEMFVGILGHDLRNPLAGIVMAARYLAETGATEDQRETAQRIGSAGNRMARLVAQLLDVTRSRLGGGIPIHRKRVDLVALVQEVIAELKFAHPEHTFVLEPEPSIIEGEWDGDRIAQVVSNLVGNAVTHGGPAATVRIRATADSEGSRLKVHNGGLPIAADVLPTIFEPYARSRRGAAGLGLGLYISAEIIRAHGGTISVTSTEADGTAFTVILPHSRPCTPRYR